MAQTTIFIDLRNTIRYLPMYTKAEYEADLEIQRKLSGKFMKKEKIFETIRVNQNIRYEKLIHDFPPKLSLNDEIKKFRKQPVKKAPLYKGENVRLLKRSSLDLKKLRTTLKIEKGLDEEDDFSSSFLGLWPQFEYEFRNRFYKAFIPDNHSSVMDILRETRQNKGNVLADAEDPDLLVTFGLINEVIYVIEYGCRMHRKKIMEVLLRILQGNVCQFFSSYSVYNCFKNLNATVRNLTMHENVFLDNKRYYESCMPIFNKPLVREWIGTSDKNLFSGYLNLLPESAEEKTISELEKRIRKSRLGHGETSDKEIISGHEKELELLKKELNEL